MKILSNSICLFICIVNLWACNYSTIKTDESAILFKKATSNSKNIRYSGLKLDSILLDPIPTSFVAKLNVSKNRLFLIDAKFCWIFEFDSSGRLIGKHVGHGIGPDELPLKKIQFCTPTPDGGYFIIGSTWDCFVFDKNFHRIDDYEINWHRSNFQPNLIRNPDPTTTDPYSLAYTTGNILIDGKIVYLPLLSLHRTFNPILPSYASEARVLATMDIRDGYINKIIGRLSPIYKQNKNIETLAYFNFDLLPDNRMIFSYPADSLIYLSNRDFKIIKEFGLSGRSINDHYIQTDELLTFWKIWYKQTQEHGYYRSIKYVPERNLIFRSYQKDKYPVKDGLQIYSSDTLIADVDVPRGFNVEGFIAPYFYSSAFIDEDKGTITVYKFRID